TVRITLIHNPGAGGERRKDAKKLRRLLGEHGHEVRYRSTKEDGWQRALKKPADLVVIAGGDGTVAKVTRRMVGRGIPMPALRAGRDQGETRWQGHLGTLSADGGAQPALRRPESAPGA